MNLDVLAWLLIAVGAVLTMLGVLANRYHVRRFREHLAALKRGDPEETPGQFREQWKVDVAERIMMWAAPVGITCLGAGATLFVLS